MKFLNVNATIILKPVFEGDVLKAGTPLDINGAIANSDAAVGLVASDTAKGAESIAVVTEGTIDLTEVAASYGTALTDDCIAALKGITFLYGGKAVVPAGGSGLPDYSEASDGDVLSIENGAPAWKPASGGGGVLVVNNTFDYDNYEWSRDKTNAEIAAAHDAGQLVVMRMRDPDGLIADEMNAIASVATEDGDLVGLSAYATAIKSAPDYYPDIGYIVPAYVFCVKYSTSNEWQYFANGPTLSAVVI